MSTDVTPCKAVPTTCGHWFNLNAAERFLPKVDTNEMLFKTRKGAWILTNGSSTAFEVENDEFAYRWLLVHGHFDAIPQDVLAEREI